MRHEILRAVATPFDVVDLGGTYGPERHRMLSELRKAELATRFDRERGALVRFRHVRLGPEEHELLVTAHRTVCDRESLGVLVSELGAIYGEEVSRAPRGVPVPLCPAQERLWFLDSLNPGTGLLNLPVAYRVKGPLDVDALERALRHVVSRQDALRTIVRMGSSGPEQLVSGRASFDLEVSALSSGSSADDAVRLHEALRALVSAPLSHAEGRVFRAGVVELGASDHVFFLVASRLVCDDASLDVFSRELSATYGALVEGRPEPLPDLPLTYRDYVAWQLEGLASGAWEKDFEYFRTQLSGFVRALELPPDRARPARMTYRGEALPFSFDRETAERIRALAREEGHTPFIVLLGALFVLFHGYTGETDLVVGTPVRGRAREEAEPLVGAFENPLVLRAELDPGASFVDFLARLRATCLEALEHQHVPFARLVEALRPERDGSRTPLFQILFGYREIGGRSTSLGPLRLERIDLDATATGTDLSFCIEDRGTDFAGEIVFARDLFERRTIERLAESFGEMVEEVTRKPRAAISTLDPFVAQRRELEAMDENGSSHSGDALVHELFEAEVRRSPDRIAVRFEGQAVTYAELDARANRIARRLRAQGVGRDDRVGLCVRRSIEMIAAMIAVHKAGGAYVPLDPAQPRERLSYMLADSGARVLISEARTAGAVDVPPGVRVLALDAGGTPPLGEVRPARPSSSEQLAYVIYTSGSTGKPKGALVEHRNVVSFFRGMEERIDLSPGGVWLAITSISFDISVLEILGSLTHGLTVVLLGDQRLGDAENSRFGIRALIENAKVTHFQCTPSQASLLLEREETRAALRPLRHLLVGGETLATPLAMSLLDAVSGEVSNAYGPTETTVWSSTHRVTRAPGPVPIGRPIAGTRFYVLDARMKRVPFGVPGELFIAGPGVVRGYHDRPELTAARFLPDPFRRGERMYRTGDIARVRYDGLVEFLGRNDLQVKIRGHRVELGEIESTLAADPSVKDAVVVSQADGLGGSRLVAYVVPRRSVEGEALRERLRKSLPSYMVPSAYVLIDALPLTPNGKIDRNALPPALLRSSPATQAPRDDVERRLARIWRAALGVPWVGVEDDFFDLGGHSLLGARMLSDVYREFDVRLSLAVLFEAPTLSSLAALVRAELDLPPPSGAPKSLRPRASLVKTAWSTIVPIQRDGMLPPFFCAAGQGGNPMNLRHVARELGKDQPFYGLQHRGVDGRLPPHESVEDMAHEFIRDMKAVQPEGPYYIGGFSGGGLVAFEMAQELVRNGDEVGALVLLEAANPRLEAPSGRERLALHRRRLGEEGLAYVRSALTARFERESARVKLVVCLRLAKLRPYEFRNEAVTAAWNAMESRYRPKPYPGTVVLLRARERDTNVFDPYNGWKPLVLGNIEVHHVDGGHTSFVAEEHAKDTAQKLALALARARHRHVALRSVPIERLIRPPDLPSEEGGAIAGVRSP
jgi:amino acid adenylation domain-containing protein